MNKVIHLPCLKRVMEVVGEEGFDLQVKCIVMVHFEKRVMMGDPGLQVNMVMHLL